MPTNEEVGDLREDRYVGMFYYIKQVRRFGQETLDISVMEQEYSSLEKVLSSIDLFRFYWWGEPYFGYYTASDEFIIRKHAQMLVDAGVDVIFLEVTNGLMFHPEWLNLLNIYQEIREEGGQTPQIAFFGPGPHRALIGRTVIEYLYEHFIF